MREILLPELKTIRMDVLSTIQDFCIEKGIVFSIACGTLLGAVRHHGFIPWDDDIDVYLYRTDYDRLIAEFPEVYKGKIRIASLERDFHWCRPYAIAYDERTSFFESKEEKDYGVSIDIFPIDDVPDDWRQWKRYNSQRRFLQRIKGLKMLSMDNTRSFWKKVLLLFIKTLTLSISARSFAVILDKKAKENNGKGYNKVFECSRGMLQNKPFDKKLFYSIQPYLFEDRSYLGFTDADSYLRSGYGNYMELPPEEKRVSHHSYKAYWK